LLKPILSAISAADFSRTSENDMNQGAAPTHRRPGRPPLPAEEAKRYPLGIRTTRELKQFLEHEAALSHRSVAQEIEYRLERSRHGDGWADGAYDHAFGRRNFGVLLLLGEVLATANRLEGVFRQPFWLDDVGEFEAVSRALLRVLAALRPAGSPHFTSDEDAEQGRLAARYAEPVLMMAADEDPERRPGWATKLRDKLGAATLKRLARWTRPESEGWGEP
jgi:hypothetical protein